MEIFSLNEPDILYIYNYPLANKSECLKTAIHIEEETINLIENPLKQNEGFGKGLLE